METETQKVPVLWYDPYRLSLSQIADLRAGKPVVAGVYGRDWGVVAPPEPVKPEWWVPTSWFLEGNG